ncbi:MAG: YncE family protein [Phycisphaerales bacterium]
MRSPYCLHCAAAVLALASPTATASAQFDPVLPGSVEPVATFALPGGAFDVLADGRLLSISPAGEVLIQSSVNSSSYITTNELAAPNASGFGASFLRVSPDGSRVAIGNNEFNAGNAVLVYDFAEFTLGLGLGNPVLPEVTITTPNFDADWADSGTLFVTGANSATFTPIVNRLDVSSGTSETVIAPAGVFSGGVAVEGDTLLVGDGQSGQVRAFDTATFPPLPLAFSDGDLVGSSTSASSIDTIGPLLLIAGQRFGEQGFATVIDRTFGASVRLQPAGPDAFYGGYFNEATQQLVVTANGVGYVYNIPVPGTLGVLTVLGLAAARRRRA